MSALTAPTLPVFPAQLRPARGHPLPRYPPSLRQVGPDPERPGKQKGRQDQLAWALQPAQARERGPAFLAPAQTLSPSVDLTEALGLCPVLCSPPLVPGAVRPAPSLIPRAHPLSTPTPSTSFPGARWAVAVARPGPSLTCAAGISTLRLGGLLNNPRIFPWGALSHKLFQEFVARERKRVPHRTGVFPFAGQ